MVIVIILIAAIIFVIYCFKDDSKDEKITVLQRGGLKKYYSNFIEYINETTTEHFPYQETKNDGEYLEYKYPIRRNRIIVGYHFIGIQHSFITKAYIYSKNINGSKITGFSKQINNRNSEPEINIEDYNIIFLTLAVKMEKLPEFTIMFDI